MKWLHKLLHPHCEDCRQEELANKECSSCTTLQRQLELAQFEREKLINALIQKELPDNIVIPREQGEIKPISTGRTPWKVMQQKLENESKLEANRLRQRLVDEEKKPSITSIPIADIEKEIGLEDADSTDTEKVS